MFPVTDGSTYTLQMGNFPGSSGAAGTVDIVINPIEPGTPYCFCDGTGATPPCGDFGAAGHGRAGGTLASGAIFTAAGDAIVGADTLVLTAPGVPSVQHGIFIPGREPRVLPPW